MKLEFYKYQATGNDFIILSNLDGSIHLSQEQIKMLCHRRFGIGADGLILIEKSPHTDFKMVYFNADGKKSSMCGNGGRCAATFAYKLGIVENNCVFEAVDGLHKANINENSVVSLSMQEVSAYEHENNTYILDTGSPHYVSFHKEIPKDYLKKAKDIRYSDRFKEKGINVNFVWGDDLLDMVTYERGVEAETFSCGTGVVAAVLAKAIKENLSSGEKTVQTKGGILKVRFEKKQEVFSQIWLEGQAKYVFNGVIEL